MCRAFAVDELPPQLRGCGPAAAAGGGGGVRLYFFRHGVSEWNLLRKWQGVQDTNLAPEGISQAEAAAAALAAAGAMRFDRALSSDLSRARQTAVILNGALGTGEVELDERLRECSLGRFEGMTRDDIKGPVGQYRQLFDDLAKLASEQRLDTPYFPELETPRQIGARAMAAAADAASALRAAGEHSALLLTHSTVLEALLAQGDTAILHCHWPFLRDLHTNLAGIAVSFSRNDSVAAG
jgi:broad specificity phosphatase PhoE